MSSQPDRYTWMVFVARIGYVAKGLVYVLVGLLSLPIVVGSGDAAGPKEALESMLGKPFGLFALGAVALGLIAYAGWRILQSVFDADDRGHDLKGVAVRIAYFVSALAYLSLAFGAVELIIGVSSSSSNRADSLTERLMQQPFGRWLVILAGACFVATGIFQFYRVITRRFSKRLDSLEMSERERTLAHWSGFLGYSARGFVYLIIGAFLAIAGWRADSEAAVGVGDSLEKLAVAPFGRPLVGVVAGGLILFGSFTLFFLAKYREIQVRDKIFDW